MALKRSVTNSQCDQEELKTEDSSPYGLSRKISMRHQQRPMTMRGNQMVQKRFLANIEDEMNELSMIKDSTNFETTQIQEESFSLDLLKKLQEVESCENPTSTQNKKNQLPFFIDTTFDNEDPQ